MSTRDGLIVLGEGFATTKTAAPQQFSGNLSVSVETVRGRTLSEARNLPPAADLPAYRKTCATDTLDFPRASICDAV